MTVLGLFLLLVTFLMGGLAVDYSNALRVRTQLQIAADSAAHAALVARASMSVAEAKAEAVLVGNAALTSEATEAALTTDDITFGVWDADKRTFAADATAREAVLVRTERSSTRNNSVSTFLLRLVGRGSWDIGRSSIFVAEVPRCLKEGLVAENVVNVTSNNRYANGFCIHSNTHVEMNNGNVFETDVIVSMPNKENLSGPSDVMTSNTGLEEALRETHYNLNVAERINAILAGITNPESRFFRPWVDGPAEVYLVDIPKLTLADWSPGSIHRLDCASESKQVQIPSGTLLTEGVLITNCQIKFGSNVTLEEVTILSTNSTSSAISAGSGLTIGRDDTCDEGGEAQIVTRGDVKLPAGISLHQGQIMALGDVSFTSQAGTVYGFSIVAGGRIDGTTNAELGFCGGATHNFFPLSFRMVA